MEEDNFNTKYLCELYEPYRSIAEEEMKNPHMDVEICLKVAEDKTVYKLVSVFRARKTPKSQLAKLLVDPSPIYRRAAARRLEELQNESQKSN